MTTVFTKPQVINQGDKPAFAVIPWDEYESLVNNQIEPDESEIWFQNEVVKANVRGDSLIKAWREYLGLTQDELAVKASLKQPALARLEKSDANPRKSTLKKIAAAMEITIGQLME